MKVCLFGTYVRDSYGIPSGNGGTLLKKILEGQNVEVVECHHPGKKLLGFISAYFFLLKKHSKTQYDIMLIPWRGILSFPLAKLIHRKPIVYFPSFYLINIIRQGISDTFPYIADMPSGLSKYLHTAVLHFNMGLSSITVIQENGIYLYCS